MRRPGPVGPPRHYARRSPHTRAARIARREALFAAVAELGALLSVDGELFGEAQARVELRRRELGWDRVAPAGSDDRGVA